MSIEARDVARFVASPDSVSFPLILAFRPYTTTWISQTSEIQLASIAIYSLHALAILQSQVAQGLLPNDLLYMPLLMTLVEVKFIEGGDLMEPSLEQGTSLEDPLTVGYLNVYVKLLVYLSLLLRLDNLSSFCHIFTHLLFEHRSPDPTMPTAHSCRRTG